MTRRGDDGSFEPHPGDPWHPGWSSDAPAEHDPAAAEAAPPAVPRRAAPGGRAAAPSHTSEPRRRRFGCGRKKERV